MNLYQAKPSLLLIDQSERAAGAPAGLPLLPAYYVRDQASRSTTVLNAETFKLLEMLIEPTPYSVFSSHYAEEELKELMRILHEHELIQVDAPTKNYARLLRAPEDPRLKGIPLVPRTIMINCTPKCNLLCKHCIVSDKHHQQREVLRFEELSIFLNDIDEHGLDNLVLSGGEPLLWQSIAKVLEDSLNRSYTVILYTNGMLINDKWLGIFKKIESLKPGGLQLHVSLDGGTPGTHDEIRGVKGSFQRIVTSLERLQQAGIPVASVESMATRELYEELDSLISICERYSIKSLYLHPVFNFDQDSRIQELELDYDFRIRFLKRIQDMSQSGYSVDVRYSDPYFPAGLFKKESARSRKEAELFLESILSGDKNKINQFSINRQQPETLMNCDGGTSQMFVDYTGAVYPCMIYANSGKDDDYCGNVKDHTLLEIWNSQGMNRARKVITREELSVCSGCEHFDHCGPTVKKCRIGSEIALNDFYGPSYLCVKYADKLGISTQMVAAYEGLLGSFSR
ncbi:radical SAM/SPASM domain-containing protein [Paenibacillus sp. FSL R7-0128]|uniref:radical SAM/SPASM domain-containing protein n=1 Tax=Paenibacillus sp. FSL R7-0128 TaxID=2954529 RepID=UPI0030F598FB